MNIAYILQQFPWPSETFALSDIVALRAAGHEVSVHTLKPMARDADELAATMGVPRDLPIHRPDWTTMLRAPLTLLRHPAIAAHLVGLALRGHGAPALERIKTLLTVPRAIEVAETIHDTGADIAHAFWGRHPGMVLYALQQFDPATPLRSGFAGAYDLVRGDFLVDLTLRTASTVFTHAEANRDFFEGRGRSDVHIVHRGIPLDLGDTAPPPRVPGTIITASALTPSKNVDGIIEAFARARMREPGLALTIYGDGEDAPRLRQLALTLGPVSFGGYVGRAELFRQMQQSAIFLFLSRKPSERLPNVVKEAMYAGCYVIAARSEGIDELIPSSDYGEIVDPGDTSAIDAAITRALCEPEADAEVRRSRGRKLIASTLSADASMARYVEIWTAALARQ